MLVLPTAKILLYLALHLGPQNPTEIYATSLSENYLWSSSPTGWTVVGKGFPSSDFTRDPSQTLTFAGTPPASSIPSYLRSVSKYHWKNNSIMVFDNGDRVEKHGDHAFYIVNAGSENEKVFTILFPAKS
jgi:hypothetical protein